MTAPAAVRLIVNADDFGYFDGVSAGILEATRAGRVTATGVMANGPALERWLGDLDAVPLLALGVHLNATLGRPLTAALAGHPVCAGGLFPSKEKLALAVLRGRLAPDLVLEEWRAQVQRCRDLGLRLRFLNAHEHVHALPPLYRRVHALAREFAIPHVRLPRPEWQAGLGLGGLVRNLAFAAVGPFNRAAVRGAPAEPPLLGLAPSGRLDAAYCARLFPRLQPGCTYELMCHPGHDDPAAVAVPALRAYHDWQGELAFLLGDTFAELLRRHRIELVPFAAGTRTAGDAGAAGIAA